MDFTQNITVKVQTEGEKSVQTLASTLDGLKTKATDLGQKMAGQVRQGFDSLRASINGAASSAGGLGGLLAGGAVLTGIATLGKQAIDAADRLDEMSQKVGVSASDLSKLQYAGQFAGASIEQVGVGLRFLNRNAVEALSGNATLQKSFQMLGISMEDLKTKSPKDMLLEVSNGLANVSDPALRSSLAMNVLGKSGADLLPMMDSLAGDGFAKVTAEAEKMGAVISDDTAAAAGQFNDNLDKLKIGLMGGANTMVATFLPALNSITDAMNTGVSSSIGKALNPLNLFKMALQGVAGVVVTVVEYIRTMASVSGTALASIADAGTAVLEGRFSDAKNIIKSGIGQMTTEVEEGLLRWEASMKKIFEGGKSGGSKPQVEIDRSAIALAANADKIAAAYKKQREEIERQNAGLKDLIGSTRDEVDLLYEIDPLEKKRLQINQNLTREIDRINTQYAKSDASLREQAIRLATIKAGIEERHALEEDREEKAKKAAERNLEYYKAAQSMIDKMRANAPTLETVLTPAEIRMQRFAEEVSYALSNAIHDGFTTLFNGGDIEDVFRNFSASVSDIFAEDLATRLDKSLTNLYDSAFGIVRKPDGSIDKAASNPAYGKMSSKAGYAAIAGGAALYGLYDAGQNGVGKGQNALNGAMQGAMIGATFSVVGAVIGAIVGALAGYFTGSEDKYKYGVPSLRGGKASLNNTENIEPADKKRMEAEMQGIFDRTWNSYVNLMLKMGGSIPDIEKIFLGTAFQQKASGKWLEHFKTYLESTLPAHIATYFYEGMKTAFTSAGMSDDAFKAFWEEAKGLDAKTRIQFWSDLADGILLLKDAAEQFAAVQNAQLGTDRFSNGKLVEEGDNTFMTNLKNSTKAIFDNARAMVSLTGADRVAAFKALGQSVEQVTRSLTEYISQITEIIQNLRETFHDAKFEHDLARIEDPNEQARFLEAEYNRIMYQIENAAALGLDPSDIEELSNRGLALLSRIYDLDPSQEASDWWHAQVAILQQNSETALTTLAEEATTAVDQLLTQLQPFKDWFLGLPVDLDAAINAVIIEFDGFAEAIAALRNRITADTTPPVTPPSTGGGSDDGEGAGDGDVPNPNPSGNSTSGLNVANMTINVSGDNVNPAEIEARVFHAVQRAQRVNAQSFERSF